MDIFSIISNAECHCYDPSRYYDKLKEFQII